MIRNATTDDFEQLFNIYQKLSINREKLEETRYQAVVQRDGFLLGIDDNESFKKLINEAFCFLLAEEDNKIIGFIIADHRDKFIDDEYKTWFDPESKNIYYKSPNATTISAVAVDPQASSKGVASSLLSELENKLLEKQIQYLFSIVTLAPVTNCPSLVFHSKNGFKRVAMGSPRKLFDLNNYSAVLLLKQLS